MVSGQEALDPEGCCARSSFVDSSALFSCWCVSRPQRPSRRRMVRLRSLDNFPEGERTFSLPTPMGLRCSRCHSSIQRRTSAFRVGRRAETSCSSRPSSALTPSATCCPSCRRRRRSKAALFRCQLRRCFGPAPAVSSTPPTLLFLLRVGVIVADGHPVPRLLLDWMHVIADARRAPWNARSVPSCASGAVLAKTRAEAGGVSTPTPWWIVRRSLGWQDRADGRTIRLCSTEPIRRRRPVATATRSSQRPDRRTCSEWRVRGGSARSRSHFRGRRGATISTESRP